MNIACIGDSLTEGYYDRGRSFHPYHSKWDDCKVVNKGLSGGLVTPTPNLWIGSKVFELQTDGETFDAIVFMAGTNDLGHGILVDKIFSSFIDITLTLKTLCKHLFISTVPDAKVIVPGKKELNQKITNWCMSQPSITLIDVYEEIPYSASLFDDALHFNVKGYDELGDVIREYISFIH